MSFDIYILPHDKGDWYCYFLSLITDSIIFISLSVNSYFLYSSASVNIWSNTQLNKSAEVVDDLDNITGSIKMENIEKSNGWFNQIAFNDSGEAMWFCNIPMEYGTNVMN